MGINLKNIFKENEEELVINRSNKAIKALIFMAIAVVAVIIIAVIIKFSGDKDALRREQIIQDIKVIKSAVENKSNEYRANPTSVSLIGCELGADEERIVHHGRDVGAFQKTMGLDLALALVRQEGIHQEFDDIHDDVIQHQGTDHLAHVLLCF